MFKPIQAVATSVGKPQSASIDEAGVKRIFMVLHGYYGNLFLSKYSTGSVNGGEDQGIANARRVWAHSLDGFDADTIQRALNRCQTQHPEFPPSLPQFIALCQSITPREVYVPPQPPAVPRIEMSPEARERIVAERRRAATEAAHRKLERESQPEGLDLLKQLVAKAVGEAGGDEVAALLRLDRELRQKVTA